MLTPLRPRPQRPALCPRRYWPRVGDEIREFPTIAAAATSNRDGEHRRAPSSTGDLGLLVRRNQNARVVGDLAERRSLALVVRWRLHTAANGVDANGAAPCAEDAGRVAAAQDAPGRNAQRVGATWGNESWIRRGGLARPDANPITLWIAIEEKAHKDVRAVVRVRSELR